MSTSDQPFTTGALAARRPGMLARSLQAASSAVAAFSEVLTNPQLRNLVLCAAGYIAGSWAYLVALGVYAYDVGGPAAVGLIGFVRVAPSAFAAPLASVLGDRYPRERVLAGASLLCAAFLAISAASVLLDAPAAIIFVLAAVTTAVSAVIRPAHWALIPVLSRKPEQVAASNVATSMVEGVAIFAGPALAGVVLALAGVEALFGLVGLMFLWAAVWAARIRTDVNTAGPAGGKRPAAGDALAGFWDTVRRPGSALLVGLFSAQTLVRGALNVLVVVAAIELLDMGESGVGFLTASFGIGGLIGAAVALGLVRRRNLGTPSAVGLVLWGLPIALVAVWANPLFALLLLAIPGIGNAVLDVAGLTLLQRITPNAVLARVMGILEGAAMAAVGAGSLMAPAIIAGLGIRGALVAIGLILPALAVMSWASLRRLDRSSVVPEEELELLRGVPLFSSLPACAVEQLAASLSPAVIPKGEAVFREGDQGDLFHYAIADGTARVSSGGVTVATLGPGDIFGEIALLQEVPRTATVTAMSDLKVFALDREAFLAAVTGYGSSARAAEEIAGARLQALRAMAG